MCMSVPQMAERCTLMSTSLWPTVGSGTSSSHMPGSARSLTSAFMDSSGDGDDAELAPGGGEGGDDLVELTGGVRGAHLRADACLAVRHDGEGEGDHVHARLEQPLGERDRARRIAQHDRHDRVLAGEEIVAEALHLLAKIARVVTQLIAQAPRGVEQLEHLEGGRGHRGRDAVREEVRPGALAQPGDDLASTRHIAAARAAERLAEGAGEDVDAVHHTLELVRAASGRPDEAGG